MVKPCDDYDARVPLARTLARAAEATQIIPPPSLELDDGGDWYLKLLESNRALFLNQLRPRLFEI